MTQIDLWPDDAAKARRLAAEIEACNQAILAYWMDTGYGDLLRCLPRAERLQTARDLNDFHLTFVGGLRRAALGIGQ